MSSQILFSFVSNKPKRLVSSDLDIDFNSVRIGTSNLPITENSGKFDFGAKILGNLLTPVGAADAATKSYVDTAIVSGGRIKEAVLIPQQLSASQGILAAEVFFAIAVAINGDTVILKSGATTETYTYVASEASPFDVATGASAASSMQNLAQAINDDSADWSALWVPTDLDSMNSGNGVVVVYEKASAAGASTSRIYGVWATQTNAKVVAYNGAIEYTTSASVGNLPSSDPAAVRFGLRREVSALVNGEIHLTLAGDTIYSYDADGTAWFTLAGGVTPVGTSASGGGTQGKLSADEDYGLVIVGGVLRAKRRTSNTTNIAAAIDIAAAGLGVKVDDSTIEADGTNFRLQLKDGGVSLAKLASLSVDENKLTASVAGAGLTGGAGAALAVGAGEAIAVAADSVAVDYTRSLQNDNAGSITVGQFVFIKSNGHVDLAQANGAYGLGTQFGIVQAATIATTASGLVAVRPGKIVGGYTGLTIGAPVYVSRSSAGGYQQDLSGFVATEMVIRMGYAISATEIELEPEFLFEY